MNSAIFVSAAIDLKLDFGAGKAFAKKIYPLCIFFQVDLCHLLVLTHRSYFVYFVLNKSMGRIPPAQLWQTSKATYILQMNKLRVQTLKMEKQP